MSSRYTDTKVRARARIQGGYHLLHQALKHSRGIGQPEGHDPKLKIVLVVLRMQSSAGSLEASLSAKTRKPNQWLRSR